MRYTSHITHACSRPLPCSGVQPLHCWNALARLCSDSAGCGRRPGPSSCAERGAGLSWGCEPEHGCTRFLATVSSPHRVVCLHDSPCPVLACGGCPVPTPCLCCVGVPGVASNSTGTTPIAALYVAARARGPSAAKVCTAAVAAQPAAARVPCCPVQSRTLASARLLASPWSHSLQCTSSISFLCERHLVSHVRMLLSPLNQVDFMPFSTMQQSWPLHQALHQALHRALQLNPPIEPSD